ncbi:uncharacterized protein LOC143547238 [Bidens hawaiensis]|uniref:uncharacterized protein LOC143547238 n=1 Tax=Bidens hawaiensis TaxID=980011 RepID=UPI004048F6A9
MAILTYLRSLWPFSKIKDDDLKESDKLLSELDIPNQTKRFMFALREPKTKSVVYVLCVQNLSERSAIDVDRVVRSIKPGAVVAVAKQSEYDDTVKLVGTDDPNVLPTSPLQVLKKCFLHRICKGWFEKVAANLVCYEIFGARFTGHLSAAEQAANDDGSSFLFLGLPAGYTIPASSSEVELETGRKSFGVQQLELITSDLIKLDSDQDAGLANIQSKDEYVAPRYTLSLYALLRDLHSAFSEIPLIQQALPYAQKLLYDVSIGHGIDTQTVSGVFMFRVAIEGLRVRLNDAARTPLKTKSQPADVDFDSLSQEEKAYAILANMLHAESKNITHLWCF